MIIRINFSSTTPIYVQLKNQIVEGIATRELKNGESLPSIRQMATDIGINMHTVNKVYSQLRAEGYITIHKRKGVIITKDNLQKDKDYFRKIEDKIKPIIADSICHGLSLNDLKYINSKIYNNLAEGSIS